MYKGDALSVPFIVPWIYRIHSFDKTKSLYIPSSATDVTPQLLWKLNPLLFYNVYLTDKRLLFSRDHRDTERSTLLSLLYMIIITACFMVYLFISKIKLKEFRTWYDRAVYWKCVNIAAYFLIIIITYYYRSYFTG